MIHAMVNRNLIGLGSWRGIVSINYLTICWISKFNPLVRLNFNQIASVRLVGVLG